MNHHRFHFWPACGLAGLLVCGCAKPVVFTTHTSIGLDVSGTAQFPNKVSFSYNRQEAALVPRQTNGEAHSVFGGLDSDISFWRGSVIKQTFATGEAAKIATGGGTGRANTSTNPATDSLVFFTGTTFGLHLTAGESQMAPNLLMGYRRAEAAYIPVPDPGQEVRSVYADVLINTKSRDDVNEGDPALAVSTNFPTVSGVRIRQSFATGRAAENLAHDADVQAKLNAAAGTVLGALERLRSRAVALRRDITLEVSRLKESQLDAGGDAMQASGLVDETNLATFKTRSAFEKSRILRDITRDLESENDVAKLEKYLVLLRDIQ
jgi:hypothetical protein